MVFKTMRNIFHFLANDVVNYKRKQTNINVAFNDVMLGELSICYLALILRLKTMFCFAQTGY